MSIEEAKVCLKGIKIISKDIFTEQTDLQDSLDAAIKSLDMWDKVIEEIDEEITTSEFEDYPTYDYRLGLEKSIEIIEKYKSED